jgi:hypothetical protein
MKNEYIVVIGQQDLESTIGSNNVNIAKEFAKQNKVLYVNNALDFYTLRQKKQDALVQKKMEFRGKQTKHSRACARTPLGVVPSSVARIY